jgi:hypothetical protein
VRMLAAVDQLTIVVNLVLIASIVISVQHQRGRRPRR